MSEFYIIGENRQIAAVNDASLVRSVVVDDVIYTYWRHSEVVGDDDTAVIKMSSSADGVTWTTPVTVYDPSALDPLLGGVTHNGTNFYLAVGEKNTTTGAVTTKILSSAAGAVFSSPVTVTWADYWACPTDLVYSGTTYYLAATARTTFDGPMRSTVKTSTNLSAWTSLGYASQTSSVDNVHARIEVTGSAVHLVAREGTFGTFGSEDRILYSEYDGQWRGTSVVTAGTGNPSIVTAEKGYAITYQDQTISTDTGIWSWMLYDLLSEEFVRRGTFSQGFLPGSGADAIVYGTGFAVTYGQRSDFDAAPGTLYFRAFSSTVDEPASGFQSKTRDSARPRDTDTLENFDVEISSGSMWISLANGLRYYMGAEDFGDKAQVNRRITASSPYYEGTYLVHAVRENVQEMLSIGILGASQNHVTENMLLLEELVSQPSFRIRLTMGDHVETWSCQQADYTIQRGHIMMHNTRAVMKISVPRLPAVSYEVN